MFNFIFMQGEEGDMEELLLNNKDAKKQKKLDPYSVKR